MLISNVSLAQTVAIDTLKQSPGLYVMDLTLESLEETDEVTLKWDAHPNLRTFVVEIRDVETNELTYQEKHYRRRATFPAAGVFSVYPLTKYRRGVPLTISLPQAIADDFTPLNTDRHLKVLEKRKERVEMQRLRDIEIAAAAEEAQEERDFFASVRGVLTFVLFGIFSLFVVLIIWLVNRYKKRPVKASYHTETDADFEKSSPTRRY